MQTPTQEIILISFIIQIKFTMSKTKPTKTTTLPGDLIIKGQVPKMENPPPPPKEKK